MTFIEVLRIVAETVNESATITIGSTAAFISWRADCSLYTRFGEGLFDTERFPPAKVRMWNKLAQLAWKTWLANKR